MSLIRWDPFGDVNTLFHLLPSATSGWPRHTADSKSRKIEWSPAADISETEKEYVIRMDLPAVRKEDVKVSLDQEGVLAIVGERKLQTDDKNEKFHRVESFYGTFERSFSLPDNVNADAVRCDSKDGILTVHIPKIETPQQKPKQITVQ